MGTETFKKRLKQNPMDRFLHEVLEPVTPQIVYVVYITQLSLVLC